MLARIALLLLVVTSLFRELREYESDGAAKELVLQVQRLKSREKLDVPVFAAILADFFTAAD